MKRQWQAYAARFEAMSRRERGMVFAAALASIIALGKLLMIDLLLARQANLAKAVAQDHAQIAALKMEIAAAVREGLFDPDAALRTRVGELRAQIAEKRRSLTEMRDDLVPPQKMAALLESILKNNGNLRLVSLRTLAPDALGESAPAGHAAASGTAGDGAAGKDGNTMASAVKAAQDFQAAEAARAAEISQAVKSAAGARAQPAAVQPAARTGGAAAIYRHGVEIVVEGSYPDMLAYLAALESMRGQLFWGRASMKVDQYPTATLSLTLYTMSLDPKWLNL